MENTADGGTHCIDQPEYEIDQVEGVLGMEAEQLGICACMVERRPTTPNLKLAFVFLDSAWPLCEMFLLGAAAHEVEPTAGKRNGVQLSSFRSSAVQPK
jgi:hypothetical protein